MQTYTHKTKGGSYIVLGQIKIKQEDRSWKFGTAYLQIGSGLTFARTNEDFDENFELLNKEQDDDQ